MQTEIEALFDRSPAQYKPDHFALFARFKDALNAGAIRAAQPDGLSDTGWRVNAWVKKGILLGFRMGAIVDMSIDRARQPFFDKSTYPTKQFDEQSGVRIVPRPPSIVVEVMMVRDVIFMPPTFVNAGAYIGNGTMIDSHALVGSCAQVGSNCHISAAAQIGGVLEPVGAMPVIIEDEVMIGGNCGVYEGTIVKQRAVLGTGTILNRSTPVYDLLRGEVYTAHENQPLVIPPFAVVVPGSRAIQGGEGREWGLSLQAAVIVKYRDARTEAKVQLEDLLR